MTSNLTPAVNLLVVAIRLGAVGATTLGSLRNLPISDVGPGAAPPRGAYNAQAEASGRAALDGAGPAAAVWEGSRVGGPKELGELVQRGRGREL
jgi:hypothetical protein